MPWAEYFLHDAGLVAIEVNWPDKAALLHFIPHDTYPAQPKIIEVQGLLKLTADHEQPWGPSTSVMTSTGPELVDGYQRLTLQMQSGDKIVIVGTEITAVGSADDDSETMWQRQYREDSVVLGEVGRVLAQAGLPSIEVRLPRRLAEAAVRAWQREGNEGPLHPETFEQRVQRHRAGTLGLIGLSIVNGGRWEATRWSSNWVRI